MSAITLVPAGAKTGPAVVSATIRMPRVGAWVANVGVNGTGPLSGKVELRIGDALTLVGTVSRAEVHEGIVQARVVAGADGLRREVQPKHYTTPSVGVVWRDLLKDAGETSSPKADAGVLAGQLESWTTLRMPAGLALRCLVPFAGSDVAWRHLPDGTVWLGRETWPVSKVREFVQIDAVPEQGIVVLSLLEPTVLPGTLIGRWKVGAVDLLVEDTKTRATVWAIP